MKNNLGLLLYFGEGEPPKGFQKAACDLERFPLPYKTSSVHIALVPHRIEHVKPWFVYPLMNELWRIIKPNGQLAVSAPYAGSPGFWGDPSHCTGINERTFHYFTPEHPAYDPKRTKPWTLEKGNPTWQTNGSIECVMRPVK